MTYYNDNDQKVCEWLAALKDASLIGDGTIDNRSIKDVNATELAGFTRCHFFAGIGGWDYALQLAGWPADRPVWTGSCPCQPFSCAGKGKGEADERHLWPEFRRLVSECHPTTIFGEQVASKAGREWLAGVRADLEGLGYAVGAADLCAAGEGAPHIRQRLYWVAHSQHAESRLRNGQVGATECGRDRLAIDGDACVVGNTNSARFGIGGSIERKQGRAVLTKGGNVCGLPYTSKQGLSDAESQDVPRAGRAEQGGATSEHGRASWADYRTIECRDGKTRRIPNYNATKPIFQLLANWFSGTMDSGWGDFIHKAKERIVTYANARKISAEEVVRAVWEAAGEEAIQRSAGGSGGISSPQVLLVALRQLERELGKVIDGETPRFCEESPAEMRTLREDTSATAAIACSPHQRGCVGQSSGELRNLVCQLSQDGASQTEAEQVIDAIYGFPLSHGLPGRVVQLRGMGNAIVPQVAATFIRAFMELKAASAAKGE